MKIIETKLPGLVIIEPNVFEDDRGYFFESFRKEWYDKIGTSQEFIQDNESRSGLGAIRGLHYQLNPHAQAKLVRVVQGMVYDVALDLRKNSPTFGQWYGIELSEKNKKQLYIPQGFAHGFSVLSETAVFSYKCNNYYNGDAERGININDPELGIEWKVEKSKQVISEKDKNAPLFSEAEMNFSLT
ncbi:MAG TPA: dTDP-4-dehydrorhamnose 3,5-epimerase [Prolixibacteraceae bacterium]|nr:dTDP-4-dehydrorhamnose 3,5-epimerase [Prolixibacteraceae bacterium]